MQIETPPFRGALSLSGVDFDFLCRALAFPDLVFGPGEGVDPPAAGVGVVGVPGTLIRGAGGVGLSHFLFPSLFSCTLIIAWHNTESR